jgi:hypothetical protein
MKAMTPLSRFTLYAGVTAAMIVGALHAIWWWVVDQAVYPSRLRARLEARAMGHISDEPPRVTE